MPKRIPISVAKQIAEAQKCCQQSKDQPSRVKRLVSTTKRLELAMQNLINCGEKLRLNLHDAATLHPEMFLSEFLEQILTNWNEAVEVARNLQGAVNPVRHETTDK